MHNNNNIMSSNKLSVLITIILSLSSALNTLSEEVLLAKEAQPPNNNNDHGGEIVDTIIISSATEEPSTVVTDTTNNSNENTKETTTTPPHEPPSHFQISAHIQTNLHTGLSYFLPLHNNSNDPSSSSSSFAHIPFLECGAIGSTTAIVPLVSGVFRHVPVVMSGSGSSMEEEKLTRGGLEFLEKGSSTAEGKDGGGAASNLNDAFFDNEEGTATITNGNNNNNYKETNNNRNNGPKRPSPPTYVVALSPLEITVGGNGNETQQFNAGDVIFFEDTWLGIWDDNDDDEMNMENKDGEEEKVRGYTMRASSESRTDMNVIMLTIPPALHRQWKHRHERQQRQQQQQQQQKQQEAAGKTNNNIIMAQDKEVVSNKKSKKNKKSPSWWKLSSLRILQKQQIITNDPLLPKPCSLESDPAFAHPSVSVPTSLSHHFSQHFTNLLRQFHSQPFHNYLSSSSSHDNGYNDLIVFPLLAQTAAATIGGATAFAGVIHLLRTVNPTVAIGFGAACVIGFGTWGIVWLGEELLDEWEMWRERRRLERRMK